MVWITQKNQQQVLLKLLQKEELQNIGNKNAHRITKTA